MNPTYTLLSWALIVGLCVTRLWLTSREMQRVRDDADQWRILHDQLLVSFGNREKELALDADRLAAIVRQTVTDIETTAVLLKDDSPPLLLEEREALRLHDEIAKRT